MTTCKQRQSGIALITALLVVAVSVIAAAAMLVTQNVAVHRSGNLLSVEQAWWYGAGVENWVGEILRQDRKDGEIDHLGENWAQPIDYLPIDEGFLRGQIVDQQGCLNINNLVGPKAESTDGQFQRLLASFENTDPYNAQNLTQAIADWIDADFEPRIPGGAEDSIYTSLDPPYRTANREMLSTTELLQVNGMTQDLYQSLRSHVCALPSGTTINVNTASANVLASLAPGLSLADGESLAMRREQDPYDTVQEFRQMEQMAGRQVDESTLAVGSSYFLLVGEIRVGNGRVNLYSLLFRKPDGEPQLLAHSKDVY